MNFLRIDDTDPDTGTIRVRYVAQNLTTSFELQATKFGTKIIGETPNLTDWTEFNNRLAEAHYQHQSIKNTGHALTEREIGYNPHE